MSKFFVSLAAAGSKVMAFSNKHPVCRGMVSYGVIWPTSCLIQQTLNGKRWGLTFILLSILKIGYIVKIINCLSISDTYDWAQCGRFALYGSCFTAPTLYMWVRLCTKVYPKNNFKAAVIKVSHIL